jgi:hypothetical protein
MSVDIRYVAWHLLIDGDNAIWPFIVIFIEPSWSVNVVTISMQPDATRRDVLSDTMHHLLDKPTKPSSMAGLCPWDNRGKANSCPPPPGT